MRGERRRGRDAVRWEMEREERRGKMGMGVGIRERNKEGTEHV